MAARYHVVACDVLDKELRALAAASPAELSLRFIQQGLHNEPEKLRAQIRSVVAETPPDVDALLIVYGLCSNGTLGLQAPAVPLAIPRAHDCVTLYLGGKARYAREHEEEPGTYWFARGFLHRDDTDGWYGYGTGEEVTSPEERERLYRQYVEEYGEEEAEYLMETLVDAWKANYTRAVMLLDDYAGVEEDRARVREFAGENGWRYEERQVDFRLLRMLLRGDWPEEEFLVLAPGEAIRATHDCAVLGPCQPDACGHVRQS